MESHDLISLARVQVELFNASDWDGIKASVLPDVVYDERGTGRVIEGVDALIDAMQAWKDFNSDVVGTVNNVIAAGNTVVLECTWEGTQDGVLEWAGGTVPPSGKRHVTPSAWVITFEGDKVRESRHYFDMMTILQQIDAVPAPVLSR